LARPRWVHSDGRPYDDFDFGKTRVYDEVDANEHEAELKRPAGARYLRRLVSRLRSGKAKGRPQ
jgi:hypothetical protein